jgi:formyltetrahydrofolate hydrolase
MAESESGLQTIRNIASSFATKWNLKFNSNKSKVLVVVKRIDKSNKWVLGDTYIEEIPWSIFLSFS